MTDQDTPLFIKIYKLYNQLYKLNKILPKSDRYTLGQKTENCCLELLENIISATIASPKEKLPYLKLANNRLEFLKVLIRVVNENQLLKDKNYLELEEILQEAGKMLGGWIRYQSKL